VAEPKIYQTYTKTNPTTDEVYSGRPSGTGTPAENVGLKSEGETSDNAINGIGPNNKKKDIYIKAAEEEFK
jgi:hypothetical protein